MNVLARTGANRGTAPRARGHAALLAVAVACALPPGAVQVSPERQQAIGIRLGVVERVARTQLLRTTGRVAPDENRTYPIVAGVSGWIRKVESVTTGDAVKEHQELVDEGIPVARFPVPPKEELN